MADKKENEELSEKKKAKKVKSYEKVIDRLKSEREALVNEVNKDYKEARRYVRSHPEEGVLIGFVGGLALGVILGRLTK